MYCGSSDINKIQKQGYQYNAYSFIFAEKYKVPEEELVDSMEPYYCNSCTSSFFTKWISKEDNKWLYSSKIPIHPSGEKISNAHIHYESEYIKTICKKLEAEGISAENKGRYTREINSLLTSIGCQPLNAKIDKGSIIQTEQVKRLLKIAKSNTFKDYLVEGSKYAGFSNEDILCTVENNLQRLKGKNKLTSYGEIGCPKWGILDSLDRQYSKCFIKGVIENFWGENCETNLKQCSSALPSNIRQIQNIKDEDFGVIGIFGCLDHTEDIEEILHRLSLRAYYICGVIEVNNESNIAPPVQHKYALNAKAIKILLQRINGKSVDCFELRYNKYVFFNSSTNKL